MQFLLLNQPFSGKHEFIFAIYLRKCQQCNNSLKLDHHGNPSLGTFTCYIFLFRVSGYVLLLWVNYPPLHQWFATYWLEQTVCKTAQSYFFIDKTNYQQLHHFLCNFQLLRQPPGNDDCILDQGLHQASRIRSLHQLFFKFEFDGWVTSSDSLFFFFSLLRWRRSVIPPSLSFCGCCIWIWRGLFWWRFQQPVKKEDRMLTHLTHWNHSNYSN